jgi:glycosyltransferase involved in cell wall biosynthesis
MIEDRDPAVFADAVIELFRDKTLYRDMSARAREFATGFDIKEYVDRLLELYRA